MSQSVVVTICHEWDKKGGRDAAVKVPLLFCFQALQARLCGLWEIRLHRLLWLKLQASQLFPGVAAVRNYFLFFGLLILICVYDMGICVGVFLGIKWSYV